jgi:hypothetical protein
MYLHMALKLYHNSLYGICMKLIVILELFFFYTSGGTIVSNKAILTAAHCIEKTFEYEAPDGNVYNFDITPNQYYPTVASMFSIYAGFLFKNLFNYLN